MVVIPFDTSKCRRCFYAAAFCAASHATWITTPVHLDGDEGTTIFRRAATPQALARIANYETQAVEGTCGVASAVIVRNGLAPKASSAFFPREQLGTGLYSQLAAIDTNANSVLLLDVAHDADPTLCRPISLLCDAFRSQKDVVRNRDDVVVHKPPVARTGLARTEGLPTSTAN